MKSKYWAGNSEQTWHIFGQLSVILKQGGILPIDIIDNQLCKEQRRLMLETAPGDRA